jgi:hypothetical protein
MMLCNGNGRGANHRAAALVNLALPPPAPRRRQQVPPLPPPPPPPPLGGVQAQAVRAPVAPRRIIGFMERQRQAVRRLQRDAAALEAINLPPTVLNAQAALNAPAVLLNVPAAVNAPVDYAALFTAAVTAASRSRRR